MGKIWSDSAVRYLVDRQICPRCDAQLMAAGWCSSCGADLAGPLGEELAEASTRAADALAVRESIIGRLPTSWPEASAAHEPARAPSSRPARPADAETPAVPGPSTQISVQSVLAVAGAGLLAVAALVFTFLNPDLTSFAMRTVITLSITLAFIGGASLFAKHGLQFSAEAVGALGAVFVLLDIWAFAQMAPTGVSGFVFAGIGTLAGSAGLMFIGARARVRAWVWASVVGIAVTPGLFGSAGGSVWSAALGSLAVAFVVLGLHSLVHRLAPRFGTVLGVEHATATIIQVVAVAVALLQLLLLDMPVGSARVFGTAAILACLSLVAAIGSRNGLARFWSFGAGALAVSAIGIVPFAANLAETAWYVALVPVATGIALVFLSALRPSVTANRAALVRGAWTVALLGSAPALLLAVMQLVSPLTPLAALTLGFGGSGPGAFVVQPTLGLATVFGVASVSATSWGVSFVVSRLGVSPDPLESSELVETIDPAGTAAPGAASAVRRTRESALWLAMLTLLTVTGWSGFDRAAQASVGLVLAAALSVAIVRVRPLFDAPASFLRPLIAGAHVLLALAASIGWIQSSTAVWVGTAVVVVLVAVTQTTPARWRSLYFGIGYAYALIVFATALNLAHVESIAVLCLTTTLASLCALAASLTKWLSPRSWYATLIVTSVPFLIGIVAVVTVRSGWTALSTGVAFALAVTLMTTRRQGMTIILRSAAAALLVPALSVVVVCLGAQLLPMSGSPIVLPIIATIVACAFPAARLIADALERRSIPAVEADASRRWIEISALVTAVLAVLLALVRIAAGLQTTFLVLVILGAGAAASALTAHRRYAWWAAGSSWTGALWCVWAIQGIDVVELYVLPPALATMITGAILVARGRDGFALYATGLTMAVVPSVVVLAVAGHGTDVAMPWRTYALLAGSLVLVLGALVVRRPLSARFSRLRTLWLPTLVIANIAAAAGAVQAVRWGLGLDPLGLSDQALVMLPVLALSVVAALLAAAGAHLLGDHAGQSGNSVPSRWRFAAAIAILVAGPITAIRPDPFSIATLMALTVGLLGLMLVVAARARTRAVSLPPVWFIFVLAWCTAVAGWSERELRVEVFSLLLGFALLGAGIIAMWPVPESQRPSGGRAGWTSWPNGFEGSWRLLTPGIIVIFLPSVLATGTDPQTWRAILVMTLALTAILLGSVRRLAAPFILSLSVLPIEVIVVFMVQIGRTINPLLWWITLAAAGAVLLVIAITSERKGADGSGITARLRDLN